MSQIDIAGAIAAAQCAKGPVVTVAVKELKFLQPLFIYDIASFYTKITAIGNTSVSIAVEVYAARYNEGVNETTNIKVSEASLIYVAVSTPGKKRLIPK